MESRKYIKRSFVICNLRHLLHDKFKGHVSRIEEKCSWSENPEKKYHFEDIGVGGSVILEWTEQRNKRGKKKKEIGRGRYRTKGRKEGRGRRC